MQTAYIVHMSEGPSIRRIVETKPTTVKPHDGKELELTIRIWDCDEHFNTKGAPKELTSKSARKSWRRLVRNEPNGEAHYHFNMRKHLMMNYGWRFEIHPELSDPLR